MLHSLTAFWQKSRAVMGINRRNLELVRPLNERRFFPLADNKVLAKAFLAAHQIPTATTLGVYDAFFQLRALPQELRRHTSFVVKPASGRGGSGIMVIVERRGRSFVTISGRQVSDDMLRRHAAAILFGAFSFGIDDRVLVEERLVAHADLYALSPQGLPDVRLLLVKGAIVLAMLRVATANSDGKANLHQGGLGLGVDVDSGRTTHAIGKQGPLTHHPDSGKPLIGVQIPHWRRVVEIGRALAAVCPLRFVGLDVAIDAVQGPLVLEFNARPGLEIQNANNKGLRPLLPGDELPPESA